MAMPFKNVMKKMPRACYAAKIRGNADNRDKSDSLPLLTASGFSVRRRPPKVGTRTLGLSYWLTTAWDSSVMWTGPCCAKSVLRDLGEASGESFALTSV